MQCGQLLGLGQKCIGTGNSLVHQSVRHMACVRRPGIKYYPRFPNEKDPEIVPTKLFRVERIRSLKKLNPTERRILNLFNLHKYGLKNVTVLKNSEQTNAQLWKVKHLVEIQPITFPYGEPTENDTQHTVLRENGECIVTKEIGIDQKRIEEYDKYKQRPERITNQTIEKFSRLKWLDGWTGGY